MQRVGAFRPHNRHTISCGGGRTRQEFKNECDVNRIIKTYGRTGQLPPSARPMQYGDFASVPDFMTAMNTVARANEAFAALPASLRKRFANDPAEYVAFCNNPENLDEMRKLGLAKPEPPAAPKEPPAGAPEKPMEAPKAPTGGQGGAA